MDECGCGAHVLAGNQQGMGTVAIGASPLAATQTTGVLLLAVSRCSLTRVCTGGSRWL
jgi:hypothetical protein